MPSVSRKSATKYLPLLGEVLRLSVLFVFAGVRLLRAPASSARKTGAGGRIFLDNFLLLSFLELGEFFGQVLIC